MLSFVSFSPVIPCVPPASLAPIRWLLFPGPQTYSECVTVTNRVNAPVEATIRSGSPDRYTVEPSSLSLSPGETVTVTIKLKLLRFAQKR